MRRERACSERYKRQARSRARRAGRGARPNKRRAATHYNRPMKVTRAIRARRSALGFTLIEIMVVIVILGVLAALVVPKVLERPDDARAVAAKSDIATIMEALKLYRLDNQRYPTSEQGLNALVAKPETPPVPPNWKPGGYLERAAQGSVAEPVSISESRIAGRSRRLQLRRGRAAGRHRQRRRHRLVGPVAHGIACTRPRGARGPRARFHADRNSRGRRHHRDRRGHRRGRVGRRRPHRRRARGEAVGRRARARQRARAMARRDAGRFRRRQRLAVLAAPGGCQPLDAGHRRRRAGRAHAARPESSCIRSRSPDKPLPPDAIVPLRASGHNEPFAFVVSGKDIAHRARPRIR